MVQKRSSKKIISQPSLLEEASICLNCGLCRDGCVMFRYLGFDPRLTPVLRLFRSSQLKDMAHVDVGNSLSYSDDLLNNLYLCTTCAYCKEVCPYELDMPAMIEKARYELRESGLKSRKIFEDKLSQIIKEENPYNELRRNRTVWLNKLDFKPPEKADLMFFVGCTPSYRTQEIAIATAKILHKAGITFGVLGKEACCGSVLIRTGFPEQAKLQAKKNLELFKGVKELIIACAGCYRAFKKDYPALGFKLPFKVTHTTEYLVDLIKKNKLKLGPINMKVTYHDPCHIARHCGIYEPPRDILNAIPGLELLEFYPTKNASYCCGAGGGVKMAFPEPATSIAYDKIDLALKMGVDAIVTACPFCLHNLRDAAKDTELKVYDIEEILLESLDNA